MNGKQYGTHALRPATASASASAVCRWSCLGLPACCCFRFITPRLGRRPSESLGACCALPSATFLLPFSPPPLLRVLYSGDDDHLSCLLSHSMGPQTTWIPMPVLLACDMTRSLAIPGGGCGDGRAGRSPFSLTVYVACLFFLSCHCILFYSTCLLVPVPLADRYRRVSAAILA